MPLRAVLYQADLLNHGAKNNHNLYSFFGGSYSQYDPFHLPNIETQNCNYANNRSYWPSVVEKEADSLLNIRSHPGYIQKKGFRRRRLGGGMNEEEVMRHQRLTHIAVERNRRKQVNEYLSVLRSLMPHSYAKKGDQASIVGGAINFVKELEQKLQCLESLKHTTNSIAGNSHLPRRISFLKFLHIFTRQFLFCVSEKRMMNMNPNIAASAADVEVSVAECFANLKIRVTSGLSPVSRKQLLARILEHLDECKLTVLHLNLCTTVEQVVLYTICMKVEDECKLTSGDEIVAAVHQLLSSKVVQ